MADIYNPPSYYFVPSTDPNVVSYQVRIRDISTGDIYGSEGFPIEAPVNGFITKPFDHLKAQVIAAGKENVPVGVTVQSVGPAGIVSVEVPDSDDSIRFIELDPPTNVQITE